MTRMAVYLLASALLLAACVTINVYFPEASAKEAADRIIDEVRGTEEDGEDEDGATLYRRDRAAPARVAMNALGTLLVPVANAQADFDATSSTKRALEASLKQRFGLLRPYYDSGAVGLTTQATIQIRDRASIPLKDRNKVRQLVAEQNDDWEALYEEIARINGRPEWIDQIRAVFAERWIAKARPGWYYRDGEGNWRQK